MRPSSSSRRTFLSQLGLTAASSAMIGGDVVRASNRADPKREMRPTGADLGSLFAEVDRIAGTPSYAYSFLSGRFRDLPEFVKTARGKIFELLRYQPAKVDPRPEMVERSDDGEYIREKILFSTALEVRVPAYVLIPKKLQGKAPGILDLHSHGGMFLFGKEKVLDLGDYHPALTEYQQRNYDGQPTSTALVRRGYVVLTIDALGFGERRAVLDRDLRLGWDRAKYSREDVTLLNEHCRAKEATLAKALILAGLNWPGVVFWDDIRSLDYLLTRPEVDPNRIGCLGVSMGGYRALFLAALDERIAAACVTGFMSTVRSMLRAHLDIHSWVHYLPGMHQYLDWPDVAVLTAPRPLLVQQCVRDELFPQKAMKEAVEKIAAGYTKAGVKDRFSGRFYDVPHRFSRAMQNEAFAWMDRRLKG
ncbi:MAG TPA: alpha/beta hydrolase family protein [Gemmataceae bacterium]|nr:alpha/beta hydrolase family protein [Gemmataceae bacterium]